MKKFKNKIILIGGATGVAKSSYSYSIMKKEKIVHKIGSGFIREMAKSFISKKKNKNLYTHSYETNLKKPILNLYLQSGNNKKTISAFFDTYSNVCTLNLSFLANLEYSSLILATKTLYPESLKFRA
tara:strand:+ start:309 stop:689 length:381 start_codon:yes stop_codon:yes gene_type:complete